jgi:Tfp pilus assembly protein PilF
MKEFSYALFILFFIGACTTAPITQKTDVVATTTETLLPPYLDGSYFGNKVNLIENEHVYQLSESQQKEFLDYFNNPGIQDIKDIQRVYEYLEKRLDNFNYYSDTFTASEALFNNQGNCLSLAILTKSLADIAQVPIKYQLIETEPVYQKQSNILVSSQHIRTVLYKPFRKINGIYYTPTSTFIDYFPTFNSRVLRTVDEAEFFSMYYANKAIEALLKNDLDLSYWTIRKALELKADDSNAHNIMAVVQNQKGYVDYAEKLYLFGLKHIEKNKTPKVEHQYLDLLDNYHSLLLRQQRHVDADKISEKIGSRTGINPYKWISLGNNAFNNRDYHKAIKHYKRAAKAAPYLHEAYGGIARAEFQLGNNESAERSFDKAMNKSHKIEVQDMYQSKLDMLKQLLTKNNPVLIKSKN